MRLLLLLVWTVLGVAAAGCGHIDVTSVRTGAVVPAILEGEWSGQWHSDQSQANGLLTVRLQEWQGQALVSIVIDNPCVEPRVYDLSLRGPGFELLAFGEPVFVAVLGPEHTLVGTYGCAMDAGTWQANWMAALPEVSDLSGAWVGTLSSAGLPEQSLRLQLVQSVRDGGLVIDGRMELPGLLPQQVPVTGAVQFRTGAFDVTLRTAEGDNPAFQMAGFGKTEPLAVELGVLAVSADPPLPFAQAVWQVDWQGR